MRRRRQQSPLSLFTVNSGADVLVRLIFLSAVVLLVSTSEVRAQASERPYALVLTADGRLALPWIEKEVCTNVHQSCRPMIMNPVTNEVARFGERWTSRFAATGNGQEVMRLASRSVPQ
jgi:hypothetical protein